MERTRAGDSARILESISRGPQTQARILDKENLFTGHAIPTVEKPRRPGDPPKLVASAQKAISELGWKPKFPKLEAIVQTAWDWHKKNPNGYAD